MLLVLCNDYCIIMDEKELTNPNYQRFDSWLSSVIQTCHHLSTLSALSRLLPRLLLLHSFFPLAPVYKPSSAVSFHCYPPTHGYISFRVPLYQHQALRKIIIIIAIAIAIIIVIITIIITTTLYSYTANVRELFISPPSLQSRHFTPSAAASLDNTAAASPSCMYHHHRVLPPERDRYSSAQVHPLHHHLATSTLTLNHLDLPSHHSAHYTSPTRGHPARAVVKPCPDARPYIHTSSVQLSRRQHYPRSLTPTTATVQKTHPLCSPPLTRSSLVHPFACTRVRRCDVSTTA